MFRVEGLFLARSSEGFKQGSGEDKVVAQSVALNRNGYWTQRLGVIFKDCSSGLLQQARLHLLKVLWAPKLSPPTGKHVQNLSLWGTLLVQTMTVSQHVTLMV